MSLKIRENFWEKFSLSELTDLEWEKLCDGCGKCCLVKLEDDETSEIYYTNISCKLFSDSNCDCSNYLNRKKIVSNCVVLTSENIEETHKWMPINCAYRLLYEGKRLHPWHHLISGSKETVHKARMSIKNSTISELTIPEEEWAEYISRDQ